MIGLIGPAAWHGAPWLLHPATHCMEPDAATAWSKSKGKWMSRFPWLLQSPTGIGCSECLQQGSGSLWAQCQATTAVQIRPSGFLDHESSTEHRGETRSPCPSMEECRAALRAARKGETVVTGVCGRLKLRRMKFCLGESKRQLNRIAFSTAVFMSVAQDVRQTRLALPSGHYYFRSSSLAC